MRQLLVLCLALGAAGVHAQIEQPSPEQGQGQRQKPAPGQPQPSSPSGQPVFRAGVEILTVDATVVDRDGRQVIDLTANEFVVEVDGDPRPVVSAEYVKLVDDTPRPIGAPPPKPPTPSPDEAFFSTNRRTLAPGRSILLLVDQGNIRVGEGRLMMRSAVKFVDGLSPSDRVAMVAIPSGALVDFTTEHERVREALLATVGLASPYRGRYHISLTEAIVTVEHSDPVLRNQLMLRECGGAVGAVEITRCEVDVEHEAGEIVNQQRQQTSASLRAMRATLGSLAAMEGPKSVILISEGLVLEGLGGEVDEIAAIAADVRASLDVMLLDVPAVDVADRLRPTTPQQDRERQVTGLESLAGLARGGLHRIISTGDNAFARVMRSIAGHYLIGVEAGGKDRDGRRHRIQVKTNRRGVTVLSRRGFLASASAAATTPADAVRRALRSPLAVNDAPMRMSTWTYKESGSSKVRVLIAAEVERSPTQSLNYTAGLVVIDRNNRGVANNVEARTLLQSEHNPAVAVFAGSVTLDPGTYTLRFALADSEGRIGSVERKFDAWDMAAGSLTVGDLLVGEAPAAPGDAIVPAIEPRVGNGRLAALMEVYDAKLSLEALQATLEILSAEGTPPLSTTPLQIGNGRSPEVGVLQGNVNTAVLPPGRYLARATVRQGGKPMGHIVRPFTVIPAARAIADGGSPIPSPLPNELLASMLTNLPLVDSKALLQPTVLATVFSNAEQTRPAAKSALVAARAGKIGPAALEALSSGDQAVAAFLRGVDLFGQGQHDRALQQLQVALQQAPTFAPTRLYLGAVLAHSQRHREAASLLQSVSPDVAGVAPVAAMTGLSWLRAGDAANAIAVLEKSAAINSIDATRTLALAYVVAQRPGDAVPLLARYLENHPKEPEALLAAIYATYARYASGAGDAAGSPSWRAATLATDRTRALGWAKTFAALKSPHQPMVEAWMEYLKRLKAEG